MLTAAFWAGIETLRAEAQSLIELLQERMSASENNLLLLGDAARNEVGHILAVQRKSFRVERLESPRR